MNVDKWDYETDLVVVGSGATGLTTAVTAATEGLEALVLEKAEVYGGTTALSAGVLWIPDNSLMKQAGIPDKPGDALTYLEHNIGNQVAEAKLQAYVTNAPKMVDYMLANSALELKMVDGFPDYRPETPGASQGGRAIEPRVLSGRKLGDMFSQLRGATTVIPFGLVCTVAEVRKLAMIRARPLGLLKVWTLFPRNLWNLVTRRRHLAIGAGLVARLRLSLHEKGVPLWLETALDELIVEDGAVIGVRATRTVGGKAESVNIRARKGVVMAAGGFERNLAMRKQFFGPDATTDWSSGSDANTGDGINAGVAAGAATEFMDDLWWMPSSMPPEGVPSPIIFERGLPHMMIVNTRGKRFANEAMPYNELGRVIYENENPPAYMVFDQTYRSRYALGTMPPGVTPDHYIKEGYIKRADTIEDLAAQADIDPDGLKQTVERFNVMAAAGKDEDFGKGDSAFDRYSGELANKPNPCLGPIAKPPFYAMQVVGGDLGTKGGLLMNEHAQVQREDGSVIDGLYAAGNNSACVMGHYYPGAGGTIGPGMTYGYLAALHAAGR
jgi:3-oxosteroid 1-dehydrogenase